MGEKRGADPSQPDETVAFGDVPPSLRSGEESSSEAEPGVHDSTSSPSGVRADESEDRAQGITHDRVPRAGGGVDTTPLSQRG